VWPLPSWKNNSQWKLWSRFYS